MTICQLMLEQLVALLLVLSDLGKVSPDGGIYTNVGNSIPDINVLHIREMQHSLPFPIMYRFPITSCSDMDG